MIKLIRDGDALGWTATLRFAPIFDAVRTRWLYLNVPLVDREDALRLGALVEAYRRLPVGQKANRGVIHMLPDYMHFFTNADEQEWTYYWRGKTRPLTLAAWDGGMAPVLEYWPMEEDPENKRILCPALLSEDQVRVYHNARSTSYYYEDRR